MAAFVDVNECAVLASGRGADWWLLYRASRRGIEVLTASIGGDRVRITCDDTDHATSLATYLVEQVGLPSSAVRTHGTAQP